jgi:DNA-binding response OmpR family regulator
MAKMRHSAVSVEREPRGLLAVSDDPITHEQLQQLGATEGFAIVYAGDCRAALDKLTFFTPSLILLDVRLPGMDTVVFARELEERGLRPGVPLLVLSANPWVASIARQIGADGYIRKPLHLSRLSRIARRLAGRGDASIVPALAESGTPAALTQST